MPPTVDTTKVLVGVASMFTAPANTAPPADTVAYGTDWTTPWTPVGATEEGVSFLVGSDTNDIRIEEQSTPVAVLVTARNIRIQASLSEDTLETMLLAYGGGSVTTQAAATGTIGKKTLTLSEQLNALAVGFDGKNSFGFFRRIYIPSVLSVADVTTAYRRAANNRAYNVEFRATCAVSAISIVDKTAAALP